LSARVAANALELARQCVPKAPFYLTGQAGGQPFSVHAEGERVRCGEGIGIVLEGSHRDSGLLGQVLHCLGQPLVRHLIARGIPAAPEEYARLGDLRTLATLIEQDPGVALSDAVMMGAVLRRNNMIATSATLAIPIAATPTVTVKGMPRRMTRRVATALPMRKPTQLTAKAMADSIGRRPYKSCST
jgi:hypothetical protein